MGTYISIITICFVNNKYVLNDCMEMKTVLVSNGKLFVISDGLI
jgi:hypothetical protein